jgi:hypothetical protein
VPLSAERNMQKSVDFYRNLIFLQKGVPLSAEICRKVHPSLRKKVLQISAEICRNLQISAERCTTLCRKKYAEICIKGHTFMQKSYISVEIYRFLQKDVPLSAERNTLLQKCTLSAEIYRKVHFLQISAERVHLSADFCNFCRKMYPFLHISAEINLQIYLCRKCAPFCRNL